MEITELGSLYFWNASSILCIFVEISLRHMLRIVGFFERM